MSLQNVRRSGTDQSELGCVIIIGLLLLPFILQQLLIALIPFLIIGAVIYLLYRLHIYDGETRKITYWVEDLLSSKSRKNIEFNQSQGKEANEETGNSNKSGTISTDELEKILKKFKEEERKKKEQRKKEKARRKQKKKMKKEKEKRRFDDLFEDNETDYARSDEYEHQEYQNNTKKKEDDLKYQELELDLKKNAFEQNKQIYEFAYEAKADRQNIRTEMAYGFSQADKQFMKFASEFSSFKNYVGEKFNHLETHFTKEINKLADYITNVRFEFKNELSDVRLYVGKEINRVDRQQMVIVDQMRKYENQVRTFYADMGRLRNEVERYSIRNEDFLNKAITMNERHRLKMEQTSQQLKLGLEIMSVKNSEFANKVATSKIQLDQITNDQYLTLKDMAYERIGINLLRKEHEHRAEIEQEKMTKLNLENRNLLDQINNAKANGKEFARLQHQLHINRENLNYVTKRAALMQQEANSVRRMAR